MIRFMLSLVLILTLILPAVAGASVVVTLRQGATYTMDFCYDPGALPLVTCEKAGVRSVYTRADVVSVKAVGEPAVETPRPVKTCKVPQVGDSEDAVRGLFWCVGVTPSIGRADRAHLGVVTLYEAPGVGIKITVLNGSVWEVIRVSR
jgi:hypothetical protein